MRDLNYLAMTHSASCYLNAMFREYSGHTINTSPAEMPNRPAQSAFIPLSETQTVIVPLKKKSLIGRHQYTNLFYLMTNNQLEEISFLRMVELLSAKLSLAYEESSDKTKTFLSRIQNSLHNIELSLKQREQDIEKIYSKDISFQEAEQGLIIGHNFHPYPKAREGFDDADFAKYSPEMAGSFGLHWFFVKPEVLHNQTAAKFDKKEWTRDLFLNEFAGASAPQIPAGYIPFPVHPWQRQHLLKNADIQNYIANKSVIDVGDSTNLWYPTSSLRSVYSPKAEYMLKFSLTLRLTNSIRHLTDVEVVRGLQVYDVFKTSKAMEFSEKYPQFQVIFEPAFVALKNPAGKMISESIVVCRENPIKDFVGEQNIVLSTLAQDNPLSGETLIQHHIRSIADAGKADLAEVSRTWFKDYLNVAVKPLIMAQANYGILLGAHQQNMILRLRDHHPVKSYFRDCQGTGYSEHGFSLYNKEVPTLVKENGNILDEKGNILFGYYLIVNSTFNVISAIAQDNWVSEEELVLILRRFLEDLRTSKPHDLGFLNYLLDQTEIYQKGNFNCSLQNLNENTTANPLAIYNLISNPIFKSSGVL